MFRDFAFYSTSSLRCEFYHFLQSDPLFNSQLRSPLLYETFLVIPIRLPGTLVLSFWSHSNLFTPLDHWMQTLYWISTCLNLTANTELFAVQADSEICVLLAASKVLCWWSRKHWHTDLSLLFFFLNKKLNPISFLYLLNIISVTVLVLWAINVASQMTVSIHIRMKANGSLHVWP